MQKKKKKKQVSRNWCKLWRKNKKYIAKPKPRSFLYFCSSISKRISIRMRVYCRGNKVQQVWPGPKASQEYVLYYSICCGRAINVVREFSFHSINRNHFSLLFDLPPACCTMSFTTMYIIVISVASWLRKVCEALKDCRRATECSHGRCPRLLATPVAGFRFPLGK